MIASIPLNEASVEVRAVALFEEHRDRLLQQTDRMFAALIALQWASGILIAMMLSPYAWDGRIRTIHVHMPVAIGLGAAISSLPIALALVRPGWAGTRMAVAVAQMLWSALLIHLTGGRIETHFHVFGSLAFLAFYRDWRVLVPASIVVAADHFLRGMFWPESVYGVADASSWRFLEHAFWVVFIDTFLISACLRGAKEMREIAMARARVEVLSETLEERVMERTAQLAETNGKLEDSLTRLRDAQGQLVEASHHAGMAEVATSVLHNVGNMLNSVNIASTVIGEGIRTSRVSSLQKVVRVLGEQAGNLSTFFSSDPRGMRLPEYLGRLDEVIRSENLLMLKEAERLQRNIDNIKVIIDVQQANAKRGSLIEDTDVNKLFEDAIACCAMCHGKREIEILREFGALPRVTLDRHKILQIIVNLLSNAKQAVQTNLDSSARIIVRSRPIDSERFAVDVEDNGCGISATDLPKIFTFGFTTKIDGHGFGLHSSACEAQGMGGTLEAKSRGPGEGACFTLVLPMNRNSPSRALVATLDHASTQPASDSPDVQP